jgi:hypothetical protein
MKNLLHCLGASLGVGLLGCATLDHQTTELEPHALITVVRPAENQPGVLKSLDGLPVSAGKTYRFRPGSHAVVVGFTELVTETAKPRTLFSIGNLSGPTEDPAANVRFSEGNRVSIQGQQPFQSMQPVNLTYEYRRVRLTTNSITVQAGGRYQLIGDHLISTSP